MEEYDIVGAFDTIEKELITSMIVNLDNHKAEETDMGIEWSQWQVEQLKCLEKYKSDNQKKYRKKFKSINRQIEIMIRTARENGGMEQEIEILEAMKKGFVKFRKSSDAMTAQFFRTNDRKLDALIKATIDDMKKAETAILRMTNDKYRQIIFNAQVYANTGAGTYEKAVDMATKDMLSSGLSCVEYANGSRHTLKDYADMAIRTASKRAYLTGEGEKRKEWGISTVIMNKRGNPCPKCLPWVGKILIDDVWSGGKKSDGPYPLMSTAVAAGLYHPRCKDSHTTYFEGISTPPDDTFTGKEISQIEELNRKEAKQQYAERQEDRFGRLAEHSLDSENREKYQRKEKEWKHLRFRTGDKISMEYAAAKESIGQNFRDITEEWLRNATPNSHKVVDLLEYTDEGVTYKVDGKYVVLDYKPHEKKIAELLEKELGGEICMVPRVNKPERVSTPDYLVAGKKYDLKRISGNSKNTLYNAVSKKKKQSNNFIFDVTESGLTESEVLEQTGRLYTSKHTMWIDEIIVIKGEKIKRITKRIN